jgi:lysophospholipase L1-like esterase
MAEAFRPLRLAGAATVAAMLLTLVLPGSVQADQTRSAAARLHGSATATLRGSATATLHGSATARLTGPAAARITGQAAAASGGSAPGTLSGPFVALGDSFAAGDLIPSSPWGTPVGCLRSSHNYGADAAAALGMTRYVDAACTGATTADLTRPQPVLLGTNPPQLSFLAKDDSVVTLTIGGDDIGFLGILETCARLGLTDLFGNPCQRHYTAGGTDQLLAAINATAPKVAAALQQISARAPAARVLLVGYPDILPSTGDGCWPLVPFAFGDVPYLSDIELDVNQMLARTAGANGATFVDTYAATAGHDACRPASVRDVEGLIPTSPAYPFHPNQRGQQVMADQVLAALGAQRPVTLSGTRST